MRSERIEACDEQGMALRIDFDWWRDRYRHTVSAIDSGGAITPLLQSVEGGTEADWPQSPPWQTLSVQEMASARSVALLVGMAGRCHWSGSIEPQPAAATICFDLACRYVPDAKHRRPPGEQGCHYLAISPLASTKLLVESDDALVSESSGLIEIRPRVVTPSGTTRWRYTIALKSTRS
jgi:hypothetical protein